MGSFLAATQLLTTLGLIGMMAIPFAEYRLPVGRPSPEGPVLSPRWSRHRVGMPRRRTGGIVGLVMVLGLVVDLLGSAPAALTAPLAEDHPSVVAGRPVPPIEGKPDVRIAIAGDTGTGAPAEVSTARRMAEQARTRPYDALLLLGDLVYDVGEARLVDRTVTEPFAPVLGGGAQLLPVLGNHDYDSGQQERILTVLGARTPWYEAQVGPVRVVVLDSNQAENAQQTQWLRERLAVPQAAGTWTLVAMHHPAYSSGHHGSDLTVRKRWGPLFAKAGVPLVLSGHDHDYERSTPQDGVTYVVSGAGALTRRVGHRDFTAVSSATLHYLDLLVYDDHLVGRAIDQDGRLLDSFTLTR